MKITYIPSDSKVVQGKENDIYKKYGKEWSIKPEGKGNGNWLLTKRSDVLVDGISYRDFVLDYYGKSRLTENLVNKFREDVEDGKIKIK